jgi:hypothetical protein
MVAKGRMGLSKFVELTATAPAQIYNLATKGSIAIGKDADIAIWNPKAKMTLSARMMHDRTGFTPWEGHSITGWPETVIRRGAVIVKDGRSGATAGSGGVFSSPQEEKEGLRPLPAPHRRRGGAADRSAAGRNGSEAELWRALVVKGARLAIPHQTA